jgi:RHS repeat-associated protein
MEPDPQVFPNEFPTRQLLNAARLRPASALRAEKGVRNLFSGEFACSTASATISCGEEKGGRNRKRVVSMTNPLGYQTSYAYNAADLLTSTTDADGRTIDYGYDAIGEKTSETWVGGNYTATYQYNASGQLTEASDPYSTYTYTYDADGRETSVSNAGTPAVPTVTLSYGYDAFGDRTSLTDSLGGEISYSYDGDLRLTSLGLSVSGTLDAQVTFGYDAASRLTGVTRSSPGGSSISASLSYDNANELTNITYSLANMSVTLARYSYGYNAGGELTSYQDNNSSSLTYGYDANGELTSATGTLNGSNYNVSYSYDANGNRTMTGYSTGTGNELTSDGTYNYTYDNDGNTLTQTNIATGSVTYYAWDYRNRLTEEKGEDKNGNVLNDEKFTYDVNNNRIAVSLNGTTQLYTVYDGANPYIDFNSSGTLTERYLTNPNALSQFYGQVNASGTVQWLLTDNINSIREVVSASGSVLDAITYDPYGNLLSQTNSANAPRFLYAGGAVDSVMGGYQFGRREENPVDGRWLSQDPLGFKAGDSDLYRYTYNSPINLTDPSGDSIGSFISTVFATTFATAVVGFQTLGNAFNSAVGLGFTSVGQPFSSQISFSFGHNALQVHNHPFVGSNQAITMGNVIIYGPGQGPNFIQPNTVPLGFHEEQHTYQSQSLGFFYFPAHIYFGLNSLLTTGDWHKGNPLEWGPESNPPTPWPTPAQWNQWWLMYRAFPVGPTIPPWGGLAQPPDAGLQPGKQGFPIL